MNKLAKKITAISICAAVCAGSLSSSISALNSDTSSSNIPVSAKAESVLTASDENTKISKDETVYILASANGKTQKIIVSDWLKNSADSDSISDRSDLTDIENVKSDETYKTDSGNVKIWNANGEDIYYQGNIEKALPAEMSVSYKLDGKTVSAEEIAGKSGRVTIRFDYENYQYELIEINGRKEKIYVPFAMITGIMLDNDTFRNIEVSNGRLVNDGDRTAVIGIAFPGLQENLAVSKEKLDITDYFEITADADNFEFGMTMTIATNDVFSKADTSKLDSADDLSSSIGELTDAMEQLINGSSELYDGLCTLLDKSGELADGVDKLADGATALRDGTSSLDDGAKRLAKGTSELSAGLNELSANNSALNGGAKQVFDTLLDTANTQLSAAGLSVSKLTIDNYADVLNNLANSLNEAEIYNQAMAQVKAEVEANRSLIEEKVTESVRQNVEEQVKAVVSEKVKQQVTSAIRENAAAQIVSEAAGMSMSDYEAAVSKGLIDSETQANIEAVIEAQMSSSEIQEKIDENVKAQMSGLTAVNDETEAQMESESVKNTIVENTEAQIQKLISENMKSDAVQSKMKAASDGATSIISLKASLDSYNTFYTGLLTYTNGVASAAEGAETVNLGAAELKDGASQLKSGTAELHNGILQLKEGVPALIDGVTQLKEGAMQLSDGLVKFNEEGIQKLADVLSGDLEGITERLRATVDVSKNYNNFSGISDDMDGQVKFIYRTSEIKTK